jgi:hypothetical protein
MSNSGFNQDYSQLAHTYTRVIALFLTATVGGFAFVVQQGLQNIESVPIDVWTLVYFAGAILSFGLSLAAFLYVRDPRIKFSQSKITNVGVVIFFVGLGFAASYVIYLVELVTHDEFLVNLMSISTGIILLLFLVCYFIFLGRHKI